MDNTHNNYVRPNKEITEGNLGASLEYVQQCMVWVIWFGLVLVQWFDATSNNISAISWWSALLMAESGVSTENHRPAASH